MLNAILITDDEKMNKHANSTGLKSILIRDKEFEEIEKILKGWWIFKISGYWKDKILGDIMDVIVSKEDIIAIEKL